MGLGASSEGGFGSSLDNSSFGLSINVGDWNDQGSETYSRFRQFGNFLITMEL